MNSKQVFLINKLNALKLMRAEFVSCFLEECTEIYEPIWRFSRQPEIMELALHKFVVGWLNSHWDKLEAILDDTECCVDRQKQSSENELLDLYCNLFRNICKNQFSGDIQSTTITASLLIQCADDNISCIQQIINAQENSEKRRNKLKTALYRHKELFQQKIDSLKSK